MTILSTWNQQEGERNLPETRRLPSRAALPLEQRKVNGDTPWLIALQVLDNSKTIEFQIERKTVIGRGIHEGFDQPYLDLTDFGAREAGVSRLHASVHVHNNCVSIQDLGSTNGTFLNGYQVQPFTDVPLENNDLLEIGKLRLKVLFVARIPQK